MTIGIRKEREEPMEDREKDIVRIYLVESVVDRNVRNMYYWFIGRRDQVGKTSRYLARLHRITS